MMDKYRQLLILQYFLKKKDKYDFKELIIKFGITYERLLKLIQDLIEKKLLSYNNNFLLEITDLGRQNIKKNDIYIMYKDSIVNTDISIYNPLKISDIYIPKRFSKKV